MELDISLRKIAEHQNGIVSGEQLRSCGLSASQVYGRKKRGEIVSVLPGVFRVAGVPDSYNARLKAVAVWLGDRGHFAGATAAHLLGLDGVERPQRISVALHCDVRSPSWLEIHRLAQDDLPPVRRVKGFRIPRVERVLAECAASLPVRVVARALDDALRRRLTTLDRMWAYLDGPGRGRRGVKRLRQMLIGRDDRDERVRSRFESKMLAILRHIPELGFVADHPLEIGKNRYFLDFYCPAAALAIECLSFRWHMGKHNAEARRDRRIRSRGIEILYFTWDDVCFRSAEVKEEIRAAVARRSPTLLHGSPLRR